MPSINGSWKLTSRGAADAPTASLADAPATLTFDSNGKLTGNGGCNQLGGNYEIAEDQITFGPITSTRKRCPEPQMSQEDIVIQVLTGTASFKVEGNILTITNKDKALVFEAIAEK